MPALIELFFLVKTLRGIKRPGPCRKCRGPIIASGATCPACGFQPGAYVNAQWSRFLRGMSVGILVGGLGTWYFNGRVDCHLTTIVAFACGCIPCIFK
jgi:hypothetical protein